MFLLSASQRSREILSGIVIGLIYYLIYVIILPQIHRLLGVEKVSESPSIDITLAAFFLAIGVLANMTRGTIYSFILNALLKILGLLAYLYIVYNKPITLYTSGGIYTVYINPDPFIFTVSIWTLATVLIDILAIIERLRPALPGALAYIREAL